MQNKQIYLGFNWKMNPSNLNDANRLLTSYQQAIENKSENIQIIAFTPSLFYFPLVRIKNELKLDLKLGLQDISSELKGANTAENSALMFDENNKNVIIGHSETRQNFKLDDLQISEKFETAIENEITPILCIGYSKSHEINYQELTIQIQKPLQKIFNKEVKTNIIIAYEPVWAIGSGNPASPEIVSQVTDFIKNLIAEKFEDLADKIKILYGGSVNSKNVLELIKIENLDGFLIGGASLKIEEFKGIIDKLSF